MKLETIIRTAVKSILANRGLSNYRIDKIAKAEIESPRSWGVPGESSVTEASVRRYYENIHTNSVFINFAGHLQRTYGITLI